MQKKKRERKKERKKKGCLHNYEICIIELIVAFTVKDLIPVINLSLVGGLSHRWVDFMENAADCSNLDLQCAILELKLTTFLMTRVTVLSPGRITSQETI